MQHKKNPSFQWLKDYPQVVTRLVLKDLSMAYTSFIQGKRGFPQWKSKNRHRPSIPVEINGDPFKFKADGVYFRIKKGQDIP